MGSADTTTMIRGPYTLQLRAGKRKAEDDRIVNRVMYKKVASPFSPNLIPGLLSRSACKGGHQQQHNCLLPDLRANIGFRDFPGKDSCPGVLIILARGSEPTRRSL